MMKIFILRHGQAEAQVTTDEARQLTHKGRAETDRVMQASVAFMAGLQHIWASPLVRAQQTAGIAAGFFPNLVIQTTDLIIPDSHPQSVIEWLDAISTRHPDEKNLSILLVSHQPLVGRLLNQLCGKDDNFHAMGTSFLAAVEVDIVAAGMGKLLWLHHP